MLFKSLPSAMYFAYNYSPSVQTPLIGYTKVDNNNNNKELSKLDKTTQAAFIQLKCKSLGYHKESLLIARYMDKHSDKDHKCPCCGHAAYNDEWLRAIGYIAHNIAGPLIKTAHHRMIIDLVIKHFIGKQSKVTFEQIAHKYGNNANTVRTYWAKIKGVIKNHESVSQHTIGDLLIDCGILDTIFKDDNKKAA